MAKTKQVLAVSLLLGGGISASRSYPAYITDKAYSKPKQSKQARDEKLKAAQEKRERRKAKRAHREI